MSADDCLMENAHSCCERAEERERYYTEAYNWRMTAADLAECLDFHIRVAPHGHTADLRVSDCPSCKQALVRYEKVKGTSSPSS